MGKKYRVRLVGEQHYDAACGACEIGQKVTIAHETGNPFDEDALVAKSQFGQTIGYIPRDSFVQGVFHEQERSVSAVIDYKAREDGRWQIGLEVEVIDRPGKTVRFKPATPERVYAITSRPSSSDDDEAVTKGDGTKWLIGLVIFVVILLFLGSR